MKQRINITIEDNVLAKIDNLAKEHKTTRSAYISDIASGKNFSSANAPIEKKCDVCERKGKGREIPSGKWTKDEIASFLDIDGLSKEYQLFMDNIEKIYYG